MLPPDTAYSGCDWGFLACLIGGFRHAGVMAYAWLVMLAAIFRPVYLLNFGIWRRRSKKLRATLRTFKLVRPKEAWLSQNGKWDIRWNISRELVCIEGILKLVGVRGNVFDNP